MAMTLSTGSVLRNRYRIEELLGSGGMGAVYRAYDVELHQHVAIKENMVAAPGILPDRFGTMRRQFQQEAAMLAGLHHPNIPGVVDHFDAPDGNQYLVMDYVEGEDLAAIIARQGSLEKQRPSPGRAGVHRTPIICTVGPPIIHQTSSRKHQSDI
jgi:serine/threonine-protein kinase